MPTYEYVCKSCGEYLEVFQSFEDRPLKTHDECGGELKKRFHPRGIVFKGSGFYATDSKVSTTKPTREVDQKKSGSSSESKPKAEAASTSSKDG